MLFKYSASGDNFTLSYDQIGFDSLQTKMIEMQKGTSANLLIMVTGDPFMDPGQDVRMAWDQAQMVYHKIYEEQERGRASLFEAAGKKEAIHENQTYV